MVKGVVYIPNAVTERIAATIASFPRDTFSIREVHESLPDVKLASVRSSVARKTRQGWLERCGRGQYRIGGVRIKTTLPHGLVAEAVWAVLFTERDGVLLSSLSIRGEAESFIGRPGIDLADNISPLLWVWYRSGYLERIGKRGEYRYRLKPGITERPLSMYS